MKILDCRNVNDKEMLITWEDEHRSLYPYAYLRLNCPCAVCRDEWSGKRIIQEEQIPKTVKPISSIAVGLYGVRFMWNDGHHTGIYGHSFLRGLCLCEKCSSSKKQSGDSCSNESNR